ncbi:RagB/SusD family nutrient uptake outer membrane protein [Joostella atrarenae]|uniref:RagB/SusD family nutrient uptake outer membrane protein n=1 Tax=Joostella atrarenae TaxID=679257 RepID=A0ABS9J4Z9_9FLAO|nr:RagB/SusD family nutrient uptake outer membrane protein [Joostella atrarenae]MCF8715517.1 RagB/SusD family nutrient uptake outer membrane protein [Joostella atrarenae]
MNLVKKISILSMFFLISACNKDILEKDPLGTLSVETFYTNQEEAIQAVNACYDGLQNYNIYGPMSIVEDVQTDDALKGGGGASDQPGMDQMQKFIASADNHIFVDKWKTYYNIIFRCNLAIERIDNMSEEDISLKVKNRLIAEAKFIRGLSYFDLTIRFGNLPIITRPNSPDDYDVERSSREDVWSFIEEDLSFSINNLSKPSELSDTDLGRATVGAAKSLLAKVYIFQKKWSEALPLLNSVIGDYDYQLSNEYEDIFSIGNELNPEIIFQVNFETGGASDGEGYNRNGWISPRTSDVNWGGIGFLLPTQDLVDEFEDGDVRLKSTILSDGDLFSGDVYDKSWSSTGYNCRKGLVAFDDYTAGTPYYVNNNYVVLRLGEVLLLRAEVYNELNQSTNALKDINAIRDRAGLLPLSEALTQKLIREAIYHERRVELCFEQKRYYDLVRWGIISETMQSKGYKFVSGKHELWAIPQGEIDINSNLAPNNPNW